MEDVILRVGQVVHYNGVKNDNRDCIPNGCSGIVKQVGAKSYNLGMILVQWQGSARGTCCWVKESKLS